MNCSTIYNKNMSSQYLLTYNIPGVIIITWHVLTHLTLVTALWGYNSCYYRSIHKEMEAQKGQVICLRSQSKQVAKAGSEPRISRARACTINHCVASPPFLTVVKNWKECLLMWKYNFLKKVRGGQNFIIQKNKPGWVKIHYNTLMPWWTVSISRSLETREISHGKESRIGNSTQWDLSPKSMPLERKRWSLLYGAQKAPWPVVFSVNTTLDSAVKFCPVRIICWPP